MILRWSQLPLLLWLVSLSFFIFGIRCISIAGSLYFRIFSGSFLIAVLSSEIATSAYGFLHYCGSYCPVYCYGWFLWFALVDSIVWLSQPLLLLATNFCASSYYCSFYIIIIIIIIIIVVVVIECLTLERLTHEWCPIVSRSYQVSWLSVI
jgi:hypothetical protein